MILELDYGYTLRCSGCRGYVTLSQAETRDLDRVLDIKSEMRRIHEDCDSYHDVAKAAAAMKARIRSERKAARGGGTQ